MRNQLLFLALFISLSAFSQKMPAYKLFNSKGKPVTFKKMIRQLEKSDMVMFGESHNNPICHWLQLETTLKLGQSRKLIMGAEMIEADNQDELNEYLKDSIDYTMLDSLARLWKNYKTDYAPLVDYAKANNIPFVASNIPRRYANLVYRKGLEALDTLSDEEKSWIAPLPFPFDPKLPTYKSILTMMGEHGTPEIVKAQASKDATMAHFILENYQPGALFIHYNGSFHSDFYEGIVWYLKLQKPNLRYGTISTVSQSDIKRLEKEHIGKADFIICVDEDMTTTY